MDSGIFEFNQNYFSVKLKTNKRIVRWDEIQELIGYKEDLFTTDIICLDIILQESIITLNEETAGWNLFLSKLYERFSSIDKDWEATIAYPAFAANSTVLFKK